MIVTGSQHRLEQNLVTLTRFPGGAGEKSDEWPAGIDAREASQLTMADNVVAGSERLGYAVSGEACDSGDSLWSGNVAHAVYIGTGCHLD